MCKSKVNAAVALKATGRYNCAQAVACTYCDEAGCAHDRMYDTTKIQVYCESNKTLFKQAEGFNLHKRCKGMH